MVLDEGRSLASSSDEASLVRRPNVAAHPEPGFAFERQLLPDQLALDDKAPRPRDVEGLLLHGRDAPEEEKRVVGDSYVLDIEHYLASEHIAVAERQIGR